MVKKSDGGGVESDYGGALGAIDCGAVIRCHGYHGEHKSKRGDEWDEGLGRSQSQSQQPNTKAGFGNETGTETGGQRLNTGTKTGRLRLSIMFVGQRLELKFQSQSPEFHLHNLLHSSLLHVEAWSSRSASRTQQACHQWLH
ncbi:hypothetical protein PIB30_023307 [Stylosanthes scabra]|uniref:Uncharacterized protein n=1 Tax=Stylosanthes scabra TaxID=79078 RepID=A0ABU6R9Q1_9FABA|nr:hypothetical protein [Stylosanthes scabra]